MSKAARLSHGLLLTLLAVGAHAAEPTFTPGFYLGGSVGGATHDVDNGGAQDSILVGFGGIGGGGIVTVLRSGLETDDDSTGWRGLAGYRFNRYFAAELEYLDFGTSHIHESYLIDVGFPFPDGFTIEKDFDTDVSGPALSALGKLPLGENFELFLRAGVLFADSKVRSGPSVLQIPPVPDTVTYSDRVLIGGVGVDWNFAGRWSARLEYQHSKNIGPNLDIAESHVELISLGVLVRL
jgi:hypothetical protein